MVRYQPPRCVFVLTDGTQVNKTAASGFALVREGHETVFVHSIRVDRHGRFTGYDRHNNVVTKGQVRR